MLYAIVAVIALILDQAVKYWTTVNVVVDTGEAKLIPGLVHLANVHNTGAAFSFLEGARWFFVILCLIFTLVVIYALAKDQITHPVCRWAAVFVLAGALGNCIDRIVCGYVVDMFEFDFLIFKRPFPVFNVADIFITLGVIVFCIALLLEKPADKKPAETKTAKPAKAAAVPAEQTESPASAAPEKKIVQAAAPEKKPERKPAARRRQKTEIPTFPKHELPEVPAMDPNDPFAEWEKRANATPAQPAAPTPAEPEIPAATTVYTQPEQPAADYVPVIPVEKPAPAQPQPEISIDVPAAAKADTSEIDEFDLDSILAEFKDL